MNTNTMEQDRTKKGDKAVRALTDAIRSGLNGLCAITIQEELETAQPGDKVFPASYLGPCNVPNYAWEDVGVGEQKRRLFLLDSIPSQARRLSTALHELTEPPVPRLLLVSNSNTR